MPVGDTAQKYLNDPPVGWLQDSSVFQMACTKLLKLGSTPVVFCLFVFCLFF